MLLTLLRPHQRHHEGERNNEARSDRTIWEACWHFDAVADAAAASAWRTVPSGRGGRT